MQNPFGWSDVAALLIVCVGKVHRCMRFSTTVAFGSFEDSYDLDCVLGFLNRQHPQFLKTREKNAILHDETKAK